MPTSFGTLQTWSRYAGRDAAGGCRRAMLEIQWAQWEMSPGVFNLAAIERAKADLAAYAAAGLTPSLGLGLHYTPTWVGAWAPDAHLVDNLGSISSTVDFVFDATVRIRAQSFVARVFAELGVAFAAVRITSGGRSELLYPERSGMTYTWWGFNAAAQHGVNLAVGQSACPLPGLRPGAMTSTQAGTWVSWYIGALVNTARWQMDMANTAGFTGRFEVLMPGFGIRPSGISAAIARGLPPRHLLGVGAAWETIARALPYPERVSLCCTSIGDGSDTSLVATGDDLVALTSSTCNAWGALRWLHRVAGAYGMGVAGENPGWNMPASINTSYADTSEAGMAARVFALISAAPRMRAFYWAHDAALTDGSLVTGMPSWNYFHRIASYAALPMAIASL